MRARGPDGRKMRAASPAAWCSTGQMWRTGGHKGVPSRWRADHGRRRRLWGTVQAVGERDAAASRQPCDGAVEDRRHGVHRRAKLKLRLRLSRREARRLVARKRLARIHLRITSVNFAGVRHVRTLTRRAG